MTVEPRRQGFARAFLDQARSDWAVYRLLERADISSCHRLHYLQMTCEKLAKAYRLRDTRSPVDELLKTHTGFVKFVGAYYLSLKHEFKGKDEQLALLITEARSLAREIEKLAPAVDRVGAPENAEYPWERDGAVVAPCRYGFPTLSRLDSGAPAGVKFLKLIERAMREFDT